MEIIARVFLDNKLIEPSDLSNFQIQSPTIDRIINDIFDNAQK